MNNEQLKLVRSALIDADHLAECSERLLGALNKVAGAEERLDAVSLCSDSDQNLAQEELNKAEELRSEYWNAVKSAAYEYRKRADRARAVLVESSPLENIGVAIERALDECDVNDVMSILTGAFVGLSVELVRRNGHDTSKQITISGGEERDITIHAPKTGGAAC